MEQQRQPQYQQQPPKASSNMPEPVMSVGDWIGTFILMAIPIINVILVLVWALSSTVNRNRRNYAIAIILIWVVFAIILIAFSSAIMVFLQDILNELI